MKDKQTWVGTPPTTCDLCGEHLTKVFIDGSTSWGAWGCMCLACHSVFGHGLGTGRGQRYELIAADVWEKTAG